MTQPAAPGTISVRLGALAIAALLIAVAALTALVIVVAIRGADLLSVVALALAIIAFSAQLIIYVVQASDSSTASRRAQELHSQTSQLLSELRERTGRTQHSVDRINSRLLEAVIGKTQNAPFEDDSQPFAERVAEAYTEASRSDPYATADPEEEVLSFAPPLPDVEARRLHKYMSQWPAPNEVADIEAKLRGMRREDREDLSRFAEDLWTTTRPGSPIGPGYRYGADDFETDGLVEKVEGWDGYTLSVEGRRLGRVFTANGEAPDWATPLLGYRSRPGPDLAEG